MKTFLNVLKRGVSWIGHILRRNLFLHDAVERHMTEEEYEYVGKKKEHRSLMI